MKFCQRHQIHLISDEIYALSVWSNPEAPNAVTFTSVLSIDTTDIIDPGLIHVLWGMSKVSLMKNLYWRIKSLTMNLKDFGANGLRIGCIISQNNIPLLDAVKANAYFSHPSSLPPWAFKDY